MTHRIRTLSQRIFHIAALLLLFLGLAYGWIQAQVTPTNEWVNFFSANSTLFGTPVPVGAVIRAFDPDGAQCGEFTVVAEGVYGVMPCYRDEKPPTPTPDLVDEGAEPGDPIAFTINGFPATPIPKSLNGTPVPAGTPVTWTQFGDLWEVDLQVVASPTPSPTITPSPTPSPMGTLPPNPTPSPTPTPQQANLRVTKTVTPTTLQVGDTVTFTIRVVNDGPAEATNVAVMDPLPAGVTFVSAAPSQGSCIESDGTVVCTLGTLAAGAEATVEIQVVVNAAGAFTNTATVSANNAAAAAARATFTVRGRARPVGGYGEPPSPLGLLGPWILWILLILGGALGVLLSAAFRRRVT